MKGTTLSQDHEVGEPVFARRIDIASGNLSWSEGAVYAVETEEATDSTLCDIKFKDGEIQCGIADKDVQRQDDYEWLKHRKLEDLKGVIPFTTDGDADEDTAAGGRCYKTILTDNKSFSSICMAMRAYDDAFVKQNQELATVEYLNLPDEFNFNTRNGVPSRRSKSRRKQQDPPRQHVSRVVEEDSQKPLASVVRENQKDGAVARVVEEDSQKPVASAMRENQKDGAEPDAKRQRVVVAESSQSEEVDASSVGTGSSSEIQSDGMGQLMKNQKIYAKTLNLFQWRAKERWSDFSRRLRIEWSEFVLLSNAEQLSRWDTLQSLQHDRWEIFTLEENALLKTNCAACERLHACTLALSLDESSLGAPMYQMERKYLKRIFQFEERRQEYLDHFLRRLNEDVDYFLLENRETQIDRHDEFLEGQEERARYHQQSEEAMLCLHLQECVNGLQLPREPS